jgi:hypothetical protein
MLLQKDLLGNSVLIFAQVGPTRSLLERLLQPLDQRALVTPLVVFVLRIKFRRTGNGVMESWQDCKPVFAAVFALRSEI